MRLPAAVPRLLQPINTNPAILRSEYNAIVTALFANGEQGVAYDPNDRATLFQNSAGTIPVTAAGQPVGRMLDKSGRGNHVTFGDGAARPMLQYNATTGAYYLQPDGVDDGGVTASIDFTGTDKVSVFAGVRKLSGAPQILVELSNDPVNNTGSFGLQYFTGIAGAFRSRGTGGSQFVQFGAQEAPISIVHSGFADISAPSVELRNNGVSAGVSTISQGNGNYGNYPLYLLRRGGTSLPFNGHFYGLVIVGRLTADVETRNVELLLARRTGVTLA